MQDEAFCVRPSLWRLNNFFSEQRTNLARQRGERGGVEFNKGISTFVSQITTELKSVLQKLRKAIKNDKVMQLVLAKIYKVFREKIYWDLKLRKPTSQKMPSPDKGLETLSLFDFLSLSSNDSAESSTKASSSTSRSIDLSDLLPPVSYDRSVTKNQPKPCKFHLINFYGSGCTRENCRFAHDMEEEQTKQICSRVTCRKRFYARHAKGLTKQEWYRAPRFFCYDHLERPSKLYKPGRLVSHTTLKKGAKIPMKKVKKQKISSRKPNGKMKNMYGALNDD